MKKSLKCLIAATASVVSTQAFAASNMENPLYMPQNREVYLKTGAAVMYKKTDNTPALQARGLAHTEEFPVWRFTEDLGYGITDRLALIGRFGYTHDDDIDRKGMHRGRMGLMYRVLDNEQPIVLDLYSEVFLSGVSPMKGSYSANGFKYDNYSNGRYGIIAGTRFGKTWDAFTLAAHLEYLQTFGNHNNKIGIDQTMTPLMGNPLVPAMYQSLTMAQLGFPDEISVNLKSQHETCAGFDAGYQISSTWSVGAGFEYYEHHDNGVKSIHTKLKDVSAVPGLTTLQQAVVDGLLAKTKNMKDGWDEYTYGYRFMIYLKTKYGSAWPAYSATSEQKAKVKDSDQDGMPDWFETQFGLNKNDASDAKTITLDKNSRYTNLEMYLHYLVKDIVAAQNAGGNYMKL